jgi:hypothetical protein
MCNFSCFLCGKFGQSLTPKAQKNCERTAEAYGTTESDIIITKTENKLSTQLMFPFDD